MGEPERPAARLRLEKELKDIEDEMARLDADLKKAGQDFAALARWLENCQSGSASWDIYATLTSNLPEKVSRYQELQRIKAEKEIKLAELTE